MATGNLKDIIKKGAKWSWIDYKAGELYKKGTMTVKKVSGAYFEVAQYAEISGKTVDMNGGMINQDSQIVLLNPGYSEVWVGVYDCVNKICGPINLTWSSDVTFCITT